jgi:hypothetical protein
VSIRFVVKSGRLNLVCYNTMSTFGNTKALKSQYISIFGFYVFLNSPQSLVWHRFQDFPKGAYLYVVINPVRRPIFNGAYVSVLGHLGQKQHQS